MGSPPQSNDRMRARQTARVVALSGFPMALWKTVVALVVVGTAGCGYISEQELRDRLDADDDGLPRWLDCDDNDPTITVFEFYRDLDQDGYGDDSVKRIEACEVREGLSERGGDCDDTRPLVNPDQVEICNQLDDDCNGRADDDVLELRTFFQDGDGDGFGDPNSVVQTCFPPEGFVPNASDCDDTDDTTFGVSTWYTDADADEWGDWSSTVISCTQPEGAVPRGGDCDDTNGDIHPDATEVCDDLGIDEDCDYRINDDDPDVDLSNGQVVWSDSDGDGLGDALKPGLRCAPAPELRWVDNRDDCDDTDSEVTTEDCPLHNISAGGSASCAVRGDSRLVCWGDSTILTGVPEGTYLDVSVGLEHACALSLDGELDCWGNTGSSTFASEDSLLGVDIDGSYTCALTDSADLQCWNGPVEYRLGVSGHDLVGFEVGTSHGCGLLDDGDIRCLGTCDEGECTVPAGPWVEVAAGREFSCGIDESGEISCWGDHPTSTPVGIFVSIRAFGRQVCASGNDGYLSCWTNTSAFPGLTPPAIALEDWDVGSAHGCGIDRSSEEVVCWGSDTFGQSTPPD